MEIIDLTKPKQGKRIELIYALQNKKRDGEPHFYESTYDIGSEAQKIMRIGTHRIDGEELDLIVVWHRYGVHEAMTTFLGHWNNGVI